MPSKLIPFLLLCTSCNNNVYYSVGVALYDTFTGFQCNKITGTMAGSRIETIAYCTDNKECEKICADLRNSK